MTTSDERLQELRRLAHAADVEPITDPEELARQSIRTLVADMGVLVPPDMPEIDVRLHGPGLPAHDIPVREATAILASLQETIASIGQVLSSHAATSSGPINSQVLKATELRLSPLIRMGSVIFHLTGPGEGILGGEVPELTGTDTLVDSAVRELFSLVAHSEAGELQTGALAGELRRFGPRDQIPPDDRDKRVLLAIPREKSQG